MKILISCDMEGISGVVDWEQVEPGHREYERFRRIMTGDVNAAIRGACDAGADEILVADGHEYGRNLLIEELDPRARLSCGSPSPLAIVNGADTGVEAALFVGYHARFGSPGALLSHTWSGVTRNLWLNGVLVGEAGLCAAVCGHFGVPALMISGDDRVCAEATELLDQVETAVVKRALSRQSAECLPLETSRRLIADAARRAVERLKAENAPAAYRLETPVRMVVELMEPGMMGCIETVPGTTKLDETRVEYVAKDMLEAYRVFQEYNALFSDD